jgi:hypothetical protein
MTAKLFSLFSLTEAQTGMLISVSFCMALVMVVGLFTLKDY